MAITPIQQPLKQKKSPLENFADALGILKSVAETGMELSSPSGGQQSQTSQPANPISLTDRLKANRIYSSGY